MPAILPLFQAAAASGQGYQGPSIMDVLNYNQRNRENYNNGILEAQRLQLAHQAMIERGQTPTQNVRSSNTPIASSILLQKQAARQALMGDESPDSMLTAIENDPHTDLNQYSKVLQDTVTRKRLAAQEQQQAQQQKNRETSDAAQSAKLQAQEADKTKREQDAQEKQTEQERVNSIKEQLIEKRGAISAARKNLENTPFNDVADAPAQQVVQALSTRPAPDEDKQTLLAYRRALAEHQQLSQQLQRSVDSPVTPQTAPQQKYQEGQILHSPSTGRTFKVVNGQIVEIPNAG